MHIKHRTLLSHIRAHPLSYTLGFILIVITLIHLFDTQTQVWDARNGQLLPDLRLTFPVWGAALEPITIIPHIMAALPDIRTGVLACLIWALLLIALYSFRHNNHMRHLGSLWLKPLYLTLIYAVFVLLIPLPNAGLSQTKHAYIISDLHSHSLISHDGVVSLRDNLSIHHQRGYDLVAITDHANLTQSIISPHSAQRGAAQGIPGMEIPVYYGGHFYISVFGMDQQTPLPNGLAWYQGNKKPSPPASTPDYLWSVKKLIHTVHQHGGVLAVVALHLDAEEVRDLAQAGVDAFEIVNFGHHPLSEEVRQALLQAQKEHGIALIASNDWHGWTGMLNTWTVVQPDPSLLHLPPEQQLITTIREHGERVIPVTAYPFHAMSTVETIFAPLIAAYQYARSISPAQLTALWVTFFLLLWLKNHWHITSISFAHSLEHTLLIGMAIAIAWHGVHLYHDWSLSKLHPPLAHQVSLAAIVIGLLALIIELFRLRQ